MAASNKSPLAIAIIAKNSAATIADAIRSIKPYCEQVVVCLDAMTTDKTASVARKAGAEVHTGLHVSEWHECAVHGKVKVQHFAKAREVSFSHLRKDLPFWGWIDADDVVQGADKLPELLANLPPQVAGIWLPYDYAKVSDNAVSTQFDRERIVRSSIPWRWMHRVHEVLAPQQGSIEHLEWIRTDSIRIVHQSEGHDTVSSARRNILCLEVELEENPNDARTLFYLGNQYFALSEWAKATYWYERSLHGDNQYQLWQTWIYISMAYERLGDLETSMNAALEAVKVVPYHPEPYWRLAVIRGLMAGDIKACEFFTGLADSLPDAPFFAFKNPLDRSFNSKIALGNAYANSGQITKARMQFESALSTVPSSEPIANAVKEFKQREVEALDADAWAKVLVSINGDAPALNIPESVWKFGRVRDIMVPRILSSRPNTQPRIIFFCGRSAEPWAPPSINTTGIGGSETAVIEIARRFAAANWRVDVFNDPDSYEGVHDGVGYWGLARFSSHETADIFVSWRNPQAADLPVKHNLSLLWCHDLNRGAVPHQTMASWGMVLGVSQWHRDYLSKVYAIDNVSYVPNGINLDRFSTKPDKRTPFRCVYASSPDRGLERLLHLWPRIVSTEPTAELHIAYGWDTIDKYIANGLHHLIPFKQEIESLIARTPGVVWRGRLPQDELAKLYQQSYSWLYPADFLEVSCISAMEAMAAGCVPVTSSAGALPETIGNGGLVVPGNVYVRSWLDYYVHIAKGVLHSPEIRLQYSAQAQERARELTWDASFTDHWLPLVASLQPSKVMS